MNFNYHEQEYEEFPNFKGGEKSLYAKMFHDEKNRIIYGKLIPGASIGVHTHETNSEIIYITKEQGEFLWMGNMRNWKRVCVIIVRRDIPTAS